MLSSHLHLNSISSTHISLSSSLYMSHVCKITNVTFVLFTLCAFSFKSVHILHFSHCSHKFDNFSVSDIIALLSK
jgi:hypothetical protein